MKTVKVAFILFLFCFPSYLNLLAINGATIQNIQIGVISATNDNLVDWGIILNIAKNDVNDYMAQNNKNYRFDFVLESAEGQASIFLEKIQDFKSRGINLVIGGAWSSQASAALSYINSNNMLLVSPSSTSPLLSIAEDNLFRLCPTDTGQSVAISKMILSWGITHVVVLQRGDAWGDGLYNAFSKEFVSTGGIIERSIRYGIETTEYNLYLSQAEESVKAAVEKSGNYNKVGFLLMSFDEADTILSGSQQYPAMSRVKWFGSDGTAISQRLSENPVASKLKIFSTYMGQNKGTLWERINKDYYAKTGYELGAYIANIYDAFWVIALSIVNTNSVDTQQLKRVFISTALKYEGINGPVRLDLAGDRIQNRYDIWGYGSIQLFGYYNDITKSVIWDTSKVTPLNSPPTVTFSAGPYSGTSGQPINFQATASDPDTPLNYNWLWGDGSSDTALSLTNIGHTYGASGTFSATLVVTDSKGSGTSKSATVNVQAPANLPPTVNINLQSSGKVGQTIQFTASVNDPEGGALTYLWNFGDGATSTTVSPTHSYTAIATYTVSLQVRDPAGATGSDSTTIVIQQNSPPQARTNGPFTIKTGETISFSSSGTMDPDANLPLSYEWDFGDGTSISRSQNPTHSYSRSGTFTVRLTVRDSLGATDIATTTATVQQNQPPIALITGPGNGKVNDVISFSSTSSNDPDGTITSYEWNFGDGTTSNNANPNHQYAASGTFTITLKVTDNQGSSNTASSQISIAEPGISPILIVAAIAAVAVVGYTAYKKYQKREKVIKPFTLKLTATPKEIPADGRSTSIIQVELISNEDKPIEAPVDLDVTVSTSKGILISPSGVRLDEATGETTVTEAIKETIDSLFKDKSSETKTITVKKGEKSSQIALVSSLDKGDVNITATSTGLKKDTIYMKFAEKRRYCMHCGAQMSTKDRSCPKCGEAPPSGGTQIKQCPNCNAVVPDRAKFCGECGARQPTQE